MQETQVQSLGQEDSLEEEMATPVFLPGESHGQESLASYSLWGCKEWDMTEWQTLYFAVKLQYFGHLMQRTDSLEETQKLGKIKGRRKTGQ